MPLWTFICKLLYGCTVSILLGIWLGVEFRSQMIILFKYWEAVRWFSKKWTILCSYSWVWGFWFLNILPALLWLLRSSSWMWSGTVVLVCLSLMTDNEYLVMCLLAMCLYSSEKCQSRFFFCPPKNWLIFFYWNYKSSLFWQQVPY